MDWNQLEQSEDPPHGILWVLLGVDPYLNLRIHELFLIPLHWYFTFQILCCVLFCIRDALRMLCVVLSILVHLLCIWFFFTLRF